MGRNSYNKNTYRRISCYYLIYNFRREMYLKNKFQSPDMSKAPPYWNKAKKYLSRKDIKMKKLIKNYTDANLTTRKDVFSLCKV